MAGMGSALLVVALMTGAMKLPSQDNLPADAVVERAAPEKCLFYFGVTPVAKADANSTNHTEQLMANSEVQQFFTDLKTQILEGFHQAAQRNPALGIIEQLEVFTLLDALSNQPLAFYVENVKVQEDGPPEVAAALVWDCGDRTDDVRRSVNKIADLIASQGNVVIEGVEVGDDKLSKIAAGPVEIVFGFHGQVLLLSVGEKAAADVIARIDKSGSAPEWLATLKTRAKIARVEATAYVNTAGIWEIVQPLIPEEKVQDLLKGLGVDKLVAISAVSGLDGEGIVSRQFLDLNGLPSDWTEAKPLVADDLKPIPDNADFAAIARVDVAWGYRRLLDVVKELNPDEPIDEKIAEAEEQIGFSISDDLLASLGDLWTAHSSPGGALPGSGFVLTVGVRDEKKLAKVHDKLLEMVKQQLAGQPNPPFAIEAKDVRGVKTYRIQPHGPVAWDPAWAVVDDRLVISATYQGLKAHIARDGKKSLASLPAIAARLEQGPISLSYENTLSGLRQAYSAIQTFGPIAVGQLSQIGIDVELPTLPDLESIEPHVLPRIDTSRRTPQGLESESTSTLPMSLNVSTPAAAGVLVALLLPAVQQAREAARRNQMQRQQRENGDQ